MKFIKKVLFSFVTAIGVTVLLIGTPMVFGYFVFFSDLCKTTSQIIENKGVVQMSLDEVEIGVLYETNDGTTNTIVVSNDKARIVTIVDTKWEKVMDMDMEVLDASQKWKVYFPLLLEVLLMVLFFSYEVQKKRNHRLHK